MKKVIKDSTWEELKDIDVGAWKDPKFKGEKIPTLESILASIPPGRRAVLEIKCGPEIVPELQRVLAARCTTAVEWPTSHSPFVSAPALLARTLSELAAG